MTTIDVENAKNVRQAMDVIIVLDPDATILAQPIVITNEILISCTVSLRSDLSQIDPSLPESEINVEAFFDHDISAIVADILDDTPVTYQAGYEGDMSPIRKFYVSGQVTWADNVLSIHAVDAVHFLDVETFPMFLGYNWGGEWYPVFQSRGPWCLYEALKDQLRMSQIDFAFEELPASWGLTSGTHKSGSVVERQNRRDLIANMINIFHTDFRSKNTGFLLSRNLWLRYVDAGIPTLTYKRPTPGLTIKEADCGDLKVELEQPIRRAYLKNGAVKSSGKTATQEAGSGTLVKDSLTAFYDFDQLCAQAQIYAENEYGQRFFVGFTGYDSETTVLPATVYVPGYEDLYDGEVVYGKFLLDNNVGENGAACPYDSYPGHTNERFPWEVFSYLRVPQAKWDELVSEEIVEADAESVGLSMVGHYFFINNRTDVIAVNRAGRDVFPDRTHWYGSVWLWSATDDPIYGAWFDYVDCGFRNLFKRSNVKGSFTWKGDPRMQPRDMFRLEREDFALLNGDGVELATESGELIEGCGGAESCTVETITLTHADGGLVAEITYRKGIC